MLPQMFRLFAAQQRAGEFGSGLLPAPHAERIGCVDLDSQNT
jgi:hypothetical protein